MNKNRLGKVIGYTRKGRPVYLVKGGSEPATETTLNDSQDQSGTGVVEPADTQAPWADYVKDLPDSIKTIVEPKFREWDSNVTKRFQKVQSDYEPLKPYQTFAEQGHDPQFLSQAVQFVEAFNNDPEAVFKAMQEHYGFGSDQGQQGTDPNQQIDNPDDQYDPRFLELEQTTNTLAEIMQAQFEAEQAAQLDQALTNELTAAKEKHGDFDETVVLGWCAANPTLSIEAAAARYNQAIEAAVAKRQAPVVPTIMGGGGSLPSQSIDPAKLSSKDRQSLVTQFLENAARE